MSNFKPEFLQILAADLVSVEKDRIMGIKGCTLDELDTYLEDILAESSLPPKNEPEN